MVRFDEDAYSQEDHFFVKEDPARIYRDLKDILVEEFDMDRIEEGAGWGKRMEFDVSTPKDRIRMQAFKEKSPHTVLKFGLSFKVKDPRDIYKVDRPDNIFKARVKVDAEVVTVYPGREPIPYLPSTNLKGDENVWGHTGLEAEEKTMFQNSKLYKILTGIWYNKFYSKEIHMYKEEAREIAVHLHNVLREKFGVEKTIHRSGASHYQPPWS